MSHEIYYTSAPEGLKRGSSGFSTVGASDNIPRALWERLEALSAYRHEFPVSGGSGNNPVSHAHWLLNVTGTTHHVLSRICDSGVDHTQRTNAFAHHIALDTGELASAGPAWMLQSGMMQESWDGQVGPISPRTLPRGERGAAICRAWEQATGDPGWGGHLADLFVKTPTRPVCILFSPGQEILPLIAEILALLPPMLRWNVTFNTYFTSMPTSATCVWRCCLAQTAAAEVALRYAAGGCVIDLTDRSRLGQISTGPYVTIARTGQLPTGVAKTVAASRPAPTAKPISARPTKNIAATPNDPELPPTPAHEDLPLSPPLPLSPSPELPLPAAIATAPRALAGRRVTPILRPADTALRAAEEHASQAAAKRRKQVLILFFSAMGALALGMALLYLMRRPPPPETPLPPPKRQSTSVQSSPVVVETPPQPIPTPQSAPVEIVKVPSHPSPTPPQPIAPPQPSLPAKQFPPVVHIASVLTAPLPGGGVSDSVQSLSFPLSDVNTPDRIQSFSLHFGNNQNDYAAKDSRFKLSASSRGGGYEVVLTATDAANRRTDEVVRLIFDLQHRGGGGGLEAHWKTPVLLRTPEITSLAYWLLQSSTLDLVGAATPEQRLAFRPWESQVIKLSETASDLKLPMPLPKEAVAVAPATLPAGWKATWYIDWEGGGAKDVTLRKPENASQVIKFEKPTSSGAIESWFLLTFRPSFGKVESTLARRMATDASDLANAESQLRAITSNIEKFRRNGARENDIQPYIEKQNAMARDVDAYKQALAGYKDLTTFAVPIELPDGMHLTNLHFVQDK